MVYCLSGALGYELKTLNPSTNERKSIFGGKNRLNDVDDTNGNRHVTDLETKIY